MRILVTGGAGFIGSHLVGALLDLGHDVTVVDDGSGDSVQKLPAEASLLRFDCRDQEQLCGATEGVAAIVHLAASVLIRGGHARSSEDLGRGLGSTHSVLEAARLTGVPHVCFASSSTVYGEHSEGRPLDENMAPRPISLYSASKLAGEAFVGAYAHLYGISACVLRLGIVLGHGLRRGVVYDFVHRLRADPSQLTVMGDGRQRKPYVAIEDVVSAFVRLGLERGDGARTYNVSGRGAVAVMEIAEEVLRVLGLHGIPVRTQQDARGWPGDIPDLELSIARATAAGWEPRFTAREAVARGVRAIVAELDR